MRWTVAIAMLALSGCQTQPIETMTYSETKALAEQIVQRCYAQGVKSGTPEMELCTGQEVQREATLRRINADRLRRGFSAAGAGLAAAGAGYRNAAANSAANRPVTCTRVPSPTGYTVRCY